MEGSGEMIRMITGLFLCFLGAAAIDNPLELAHTDTLLDWYTFIALTGIGLPLMMFGARSLAR